MRLSLCTLRLGDVKNAWSSCEKWGNSKLKKLCKKRRNSLQNWKEVWVGNFRGGKFGKFGIFCVAEYFVSKFSPPNFGRIRKNVFLIKKFVNSITIFTELLQYCRYRLDNIQQYCMCAKNSVCWNHFWRSAHDCIPRSIDRWIDAWEVRCASELPFIK